QAGELFLNAVKGKRRFFQPEIGNESASDSEDRSAGASRNELRMNGEAEKSAAKSGSEIKQQKCIAAHQAFREAAQRKQTPHIHQKMKKSEMEKQRGEQPPPLAGEG